MDFDLKLIHVPRKQLIAPDALSRCPDLLPENADLDNNNVTLLPDSMFVCIIDCTLVSTISNASATDPLVLQHLQTLNDDIPAHLRSRLADFQMRDNLLTYQGCMYVPPTNDLRRTIVAQNHNHPTTGHPGFLKTRQLVAAHYWWPGLVQFVRKYVEGCGACQQAKTNTHPTFPPPCSHPILLHPPFPADLLQSDHRPSPFPGL